MGSAKAWLYPYTDFGEGREYLPHPVLRAVVPVGSPGLKVTFAAIIDTGGPITVVSPAFADAVGDEAHDSGARTVLRLAGRRYDAPLLSVTLALHSSWEAPEDLRYGRAWSACLTPGRTRGPR